MAALATPSPTVPICLLEMHLHEANASKANNAARPTHNTSVVAVPPASQ